MGLFEIIAILITLSALFAWINYRFLKLPITIGLMVVALLFSLSLVAVGSVAPWVRNQAEALISSVDFDETLMHGMLGFLLFAGALHVDLSELANKKWVIGSLATIGVITSTAIVGGLVWLLFGLFGVEAELIWCLVFGALISPTDPVAVMGILKHAGAPKSLEIKIAGESLFNDGVGVVIFLGLLQIATGEHGFDVPHLAMLFVEEAIGGAVFGLVLGYIAYRMMRTVEDYQVEVLISLALVAGGYALAMAIHVSGPIAMVVAGLLIGNRGRLLAMSDTTREHLDSFWMLTDEILNAVLFVLIGLEILVLTFTSQYLVVGALAIPAVLLARLIAVALPMSLLRMGGERFTRGALPALTWGGLRGGISVALALSLPVAVRGVPVAEREPILAITYVVVVFSIIVQGLTIGPLVKRLVRADGNETAAEAGSGTAVPSGH